MKYIPLLVLLIIAAGFAAADVITTYSDSGYSTPATTFTQGDVAYVQAIVAGASHTNASAFSSDDAVGVNFSLPSFGGGIYRGNVTLSAASAEGTAINASSDYASVNVSADLDNDGSAGSVLLTVDNAAPTISVVINASSLSPGQTLLITATVDDATTGVDNVTIMIGAMQLAASNTSDDTFTATWTTNSTEDSYTVNVTANDTVDNFGWDGTSTFSIDATGPAFSNFLPIAGGYTQDTTPLTCVDITDSAGVTASSVWMRVSTSSWIDGPGNNTESNRNTTAITNGHTACWWHTPSQYFGNTSYVTVWANATDGLGNTASITWNFTVDVDKPFSVSISSPTNTTYNTGAITLTVTARDTASATMDCNYTLNGMETVIGPIADNTANSTALALGDGTFSVYATCADVAGNTNSSETVWFMVDAIPPQIVIALNATNGYINSTQSIGVTSNVTDTSLDNVSTYVNGMMVPTTGTGPYVATYANTTAGYYVVNVTANDTAGNWNQSEAGYWVDGTAPVIAVTSPTSTNYTNSSVYLKFTATDDIAPNMSCGYTLNNTYTAIGSINNSMLSTTEFNLTDNNYEINVTCIDLAGKNATSASVSFIVDSMGPTVGTPVITPASPTNTNIGLNINATYSDPGTGVQKCWYNTTAWVNGSMSLSAGTANATTTVVMPDGTHSVNVTCVDGAAFTTTSAVANVTIDTAAPGFASVVPANATNFADSVIAFNITATEQVDTLDYPFHYGNGTLLEANQVIGVWGANGTRTLANGTYYLNSAVADGAGNTANNVSWFTVADSTPPAQATAVTATAGVQQVTIAWNASTEADVCGYNVYRNTTDFASTVNATIVATLAASTTSWANGGLTAGTPYYFAVVPYDCNGNYNTTVNTVSATPTAPAAPPGGGGGGGGGGSSGGGGSGSSTMVIDLFDDTLESKVVGIKRYADMCGLDTDLASLGKFYLGDRYDAEATAEHCADFSAARDYSFDFPNTRTTWSLKTRSHMTEEAKVLFVDFVPKEFAESADEVLRSKPSVVLLNDPVIGFEATVGSGDIWENDYTVGKFVDHVLVERLDKPVVLFIKEPTVPEIPVEPEPVILPSGEPVPAVGPMTGLLTLPSPEDVDKGQFYTGLAALLALMSLLALGFAAKKAAKRKWYEK